MGGELLPIVNRRFVSRKEVLAGCRLGSPKLDSLSNENTVLETIELGNGPQGKATVVYQELLSLCKSALLAKPWHDDQSVLSYLCSRSCCILRSRVS